MSLATQQPATCGEGKSAWLQDVVDSKRESRRQPIFLQGRKSARTILLLIPERRDRGRPMDRLLAVLAFLISQRSFKEECVSEAAPASRGCV